MIVRVAISGPLAREYLYTLNTLGRHHGHRYELLPEHAQVQIGASGIQVSEAFAGRYEAGLREHERFFDGEPVVRNADGTVDNLSTAFYLLSGAQEWECSGGKPVARDAFGRFPFAGSVQQRFGTVAVDAVSTCYENFLEEAAVAGLALATPRASRVFLSHDIDSLRWSTFTQARFAVKRRDPGALLRLLFSALLRRNDKADLDRIMRWEEAADLRSTYFWLTQQETQNDVPHADYDVREELPRRLLEVTSRRGHTVGLHKSATNASFADELDRLHTRTTANRFHFLKYRLPESFDALEAAGIQLDASAGFPEASGFRNSYGLPFQPYHHVQRRPYRFVEAPLNVMDTTFLYYQRDDADAARRAIVDLLDRHRTNRIIGLLFHNEYLAPGVFDPWVKLYRDLLMYFRDNGWSGIGPQEIVDTYGPRETTSKSVNGES